MHTMTKEVKKFYYAPGSKILKNERKNMFRIIMMAGMSFKFLITIRQIKNL